MPYHQIISLVVTLIVSGFSITLILSKFKGMSLSYHKLNLDHYEKMKALCGRDANEKLCELRVALVAYTNKPLLINEIEWFIHVPGAFTHLKKFGKCHKYLGIDILNNKFIWSEKFQTRKNIIIEQFKVFFFYVILGTLGVFIILSYEFIYNLLGIIPAIFSQVFALFLCGGALSFLRVLDVIGDSKQLLKVELC